MKQKEEASSEEKRGRGKPRNPDALTPAARAKRYREKLKATRSTMQVERRDKNSDVERVADLEDKLIKLQMKYDSEHMTVVNLQTQLAFFQQAIAKKSAPNPLAEQVTKLLERVAEQDKIISAYSSEINRLRDGRNASRKKTPAAPQE